MNTKKEEPSQSQPQPQPQPQPQAQKGDDAPAPPCPPPPPGPPPGPSDHLHSRGGNTIFKSGPLFISSKGIGWTSWKKRWFILTRTSLVFFRSDPSAVTQKGTEVNLTLGGIDLNNSGSVVVKADKKLLTVLFPDGRAFTLKAETLEDLHDWKAKLENALAQAPSPAHVMGQNGIFRNDQVDAADGSKEQLNDKQPPRSTVLGRPILLALEDVDGAPTFLEKALRFVDEYGIKVEGILRQAADVDDVEHRIREYEQGKSEFAPDEDPHVIADCVKYVIRELPSSPVPASCCNALLEACRTDRGNRVNAMRAAICETFPEPNRRLLQRILTMMQTVASHKAENRMSPSAVAACMAPLLLRPLLAGDCEIENDFDVGGDGSIQLLQAAAAANHAQAIVITLLEEYDSIFGEGSVSPDLYSDTEESGSESEEATDDDESYDEEDEEEDGEDDDVTQGSDAYSTDDDLESASSRTGSEKDSSDNNDLDIDKDPDDSSAGFVSPAGRDLEPHLQLSSNSTKTSLPLNNDACETSENILNEKSNDMEMQINECAERPTDVPAKTNFENMPNSNSPISRIPKSMTISNGPGHSAKPPTVWGRTAAKKNLSMESIDIPVEEEAEIERLEATKSDLQNRIAEEVISNTILQASLEKRKKSLHERRLALEKDVARLQVELQKERDKRAALEAGLDSSQGLVSVPATIDEKTKAELKEIAQAEADIINLNQKVDDLSMQLNQQRQQNSVSLYGSSNQPQKTSNHQAKVKNEQKVTEPAAASPFGRSTSKDAYLDGADSENEKQQESSLRNKHPTQNQQLDSVSNSNSKATGSSKSKKSGTKGEGGNSTTSALTKLTNRLNFLKERRSQIANELQNMDKGRRSSQAVSGSEKGRISEPGQSVQNPEMSKGLASADRAVAFECQTLPHSEKNRKSENHNLDAGRRIEGQQNPHVLDRGRSEGHVAYNADKDPGVGQPVVASRTFSR